VRDGAVQSFDAWDRDLVIAAPRTSADVYTEECDPRQAAGKECAVRARISSETTMVVQPARAR
jgi:hypothetical protein